MELFASTLSENTKTAAQLVVSKGYASTSMLCREMNIEYNESAKLMDDLEKMNIVSDFKGSKSREVLVDNSQLQKILSNKG